MRSFYLLIIIFVPSFLYGQFKYTFTQDNFDLEEFNRTIMVLGVYDTLEIKDFDSYVNGLNGLKNVWCSAINFINYKTNSYLNLTNIKAENLTFESCRLNAFILDRGKIGNIDFSYTDSDLIRISNMDSTGFNYNGNVFESSMSFGIYNSILTGVYLKNINFPDIRFEGNRFILNQDKIFRGFNIHNTKCNELTIIQNSTLTASYEDEWGWRNVMHNIELLNCEVNNCLIWNNKNNNKFSDSLDSKFLLSSYSIINSNFKKFHMKLDTIDFLSLTSSIVESDLNIENDCKIEYISFGQKNSLSLLPEYGIRTNYSNLFGKIITPDTNDYIFRKTDLFLKNYILHNNYKGINEDVLFKSHLSTLMRFNSAYRAQGNRLDANLVYQEIKDVETEYFYEKYRETDDFGFYANYQLNRFLKTFSDYGTNPIKSVKISFWLILVFAGVYFFTYSDWDKINRQFFIKKSNQLIQYFTSEQKLEDFYSESFKEDTLTYEEFKENLKSKKAEIPFFFMVLMRPLYVISVLKYKFNAWMYRRIEILKGRWIDLKRWKKFTVGTTVFIWSILYLAYLAVVRGLNSIVLSINTFSTLGFGDIPVKGIGRYIAIIEGFIGWFLLSIFSVSLISQILQN